MFDPDQNRSPALRLGPASADLPDGVTPAMVERVRLAMRATLESPAATEDAVIVAACRAVLASLGA